MAKIEAEVKLLDLEIVQEMSKDYQEAVLILNKLINAPTSWDLDYLLEEAADYLDRVEEKYE